MRFASPLTLAVLTVLVARPGLAGKKILYVTEGTPGNIAGYCVNNDGSLAATASFRFTLRDGIDPTKTFPRRLVVDQPVPPRTGAPNGVAYVVETDRVEAFRIGDGGGLRPIGHTKPVTAMQSIDIAVSENGKYLYVPQTGKNRIVAYPLNDADGSFASEPTTCVQGPSPASYQRLVATNGLLYVVETDNSARVNVFKPNADGTLPAIYPDECQPAQNGGKRPAPTDPTANGGSVRKRLSSPKPFAVATIAGVPFLYVEERGPHLIEGFRLDPSTVCDPPDTTLGLGNFCPGVPTHPKAKALRFQRHDSKTAKGINYEDLIVQGNTVLAANFGKGRIDAFLIPTSGPRTGKLPQLPTASSTQDIRMSPVHLTADGNVLYVATGALDEVTAFHLRRADGLLTDKNPFSATAEETGSFPNDVAVAVLPQQCQ
jgi:6-phosphogluconolactonase (cycloisomerase 2 family)